MNLKKLIEDVGVNNLLFLANMKQIKTYFGLISLTSSSDPDMLVICKIVETKYKVKDNYKITLQALNQKIGIKAQEHYYISDLEQMINSNQIGVLHVINNIQTLITQQ